MFGIWISLAVCSVLSTTAAVSVFLHHQEINAFIKTFGIRPPAQRWPVVLGLKKSERQATRPAQVSLWLCDLLSEYKQIKIYRIDLRLSWTQEQWEFALWKCESDFLHALGLAESFGYDVAEYRRNYKEFNDLFDYPPMPATGSVPRTM